MKDGNLKDALVRDFGSVEKFKESMNGKTAAIQGSGWGWLVRGLVTGCCNVSDNGPGI